MKRAISLLTALFLLLITGCSGTGSSTGVRLEFYYGVPSDKHFGSSLDSETDYLENPTVSSVMNRLLEGPNSAELSSIIPDGTTVQNWSLRDGKLEMDLSESFGRLTGISLTRAEYSIVLTLTQLDSVDCVSLTVDGQTIPGSGTEEMTADDVILRGETEDPVMISTQLYFPLSDNTGLGVEFREIEVATMDLIDQANAILQELTSGPMEEEMTGFLSAAEVLQVTEIQDTTCIVEIDSATLESICNPEEQFELHLYSIVDSLTELEEIEQVSFLLDGVPIEDWESEYTAQYEF